MNATAMARNVALPRILTGQVTAIAGVRDGFHVAIWFDGLRKEVPAGPTFRRPQDAIALVHELNGVPASPGAAQPAPSTTGDDVEQVGRLPEAPAIPQVNASPGLTCPGCGGPLSAGRRGQARLTCSLACRERVRYQHAAAERRPDADSGAADLTPSRPSVDDPAPPDLGL